MRRYFYCSALSYLEYAQLTNSKLEQSQQLDKAAEFMVAFYLEGKK